MREIAFAAAGGLTLVLAPLSRRLRHWPLSEPLVALVLGVALGAVGALELPQAQERRVLEVGAEIVLALSLMAVALRFPIDDFLSRRGDIAALTVVAMVGMAAMTAVLAWLILDIPWEAAALLGAVMAPTDPVLASNIVEGEPAERDIPERVRVLVSAESGINDALALPLVVVAIAVITGDGVVVESGVAAARILVGLALGVAVGWVAGHLVVTADRHREFERTAFLVFTVALALFTLGLAGLLGAASLLSVVTAGVAFNRRISERERREEWEVEEAISRYLVLPIFVLLGAALPWGDWADLSWRGVVLVAAVLALRRLLVVVPVSRALGLRLSEAVFMGYFGPVGVASLFYLAHAHGEQALTEPLWAAGTLVVAASTTVFGLTATQGRRMLSSALAPTGGGAHG